MTILDESSSRIELIAKGGALLAAGIYGAGFTIISLYQAQFGMCAPCLDTRT